MAAVYKSLSKKGTSKKPEAPVNGVQKNKQRVLILSSRGVTYRYATPSPSFHSPNFPPPR